MGLAPEEQEINDDFIVQMSNILRQTIGTDATCKNFTWITVNDFGVIITGPLRPCYLGI